jgi:hypothetical protein
MTLNEARDKAGMVPYSDMPEADEPYILARMGPQFIRGLQEQQLAQGEAVKAGAEMAQRNLDAGNLPSGKAPNTPKAERADGDEPTPDGDTTPTAGGDEPEPKGGDAKAGDKAKPASKPPAKGTAPPAQKTAAAELASFAVWSARLAKTGKTVARPFAFAAVDDSVARELNHLVLDDSPADAASLAKALAAELRKAGGAGGRDSGPRPEPGAGPVARVPGARRAGPSDGAARVPGCWPSY